MCSDWSGPGRTTCQRPAERPVPAHISPSFGSNSPRDRLRVILGGLFRSRLVLRWLMSSLRGPGLPAGRLLLAGIVVLMILIGLPVTIHAAQPGEGSSMSARCEPPPLGDFLRKSFIVDLLRNNGPAGPSSVSPVDDSITSLVVRSSDSNATVRLSIREAVASSTNSGISIAMLISLPP